MKLKFVLVIIGFTILSYANCSKEEVIKLGDKGHSKLEINKICEKDKPKKEELKWISPSKKVCKENEGKMIGGICRANWSNAKNICSA